MPVPQISSITPDSIWANILKAEGGFVNDPRDPGGATKYGISSRSYPDEDIPNMTISRAGEIFKRDYYNKIGGDALLKINPGLAAHAADMAFNAGPGTAIKLLYDTAGLPRSNSVSPELIQALASQDQLVRKYTDARMGYYSSLANAPTFLKGWTNRVNNLNKSLKGKFGDVQLMDASSAPGKVRNATINVPNTPSEPDKELLRQIRTEASSTYLRNSEDVQHLKDPYTQESTFKEMFNAYYDSDRYNYTTQVNGIKQDIRNVMADEATKDLSGKLSQTDLEDAVTAIRNNSLSPDDRFAVLTRIQQTNPGVNLNKYSDQEFLARFDKQFNTDSANWEKINSGDWFNSPDGFFKKLGKMIGAYVPATVANIVQDPAALVANLAGGVPKLGVAALTKAALKVGAADYVQNLFANKSVEGTAAERSDADMALRAAGAGIGFAALAGLGHGINRLWRTSSKRVANVMDDVAKSADALEHVAAPESREALRTMSRESKLYKEQYSKNPFGTSLAAKQKLDIAAEAAYKDIATNVPVRPAPVLPSKLSKIDPKPFEIASRISDMPEVKIKHEEAIKGWESFKQNFTTTQEISIPDSSINSFVPITNKYDVPVTFQTKQQAYEYLRSPEGIKLAQKEKVKIVDHPTQEGVYLARSSPVEPVTGPSSVIKTASPDEVSLIPGKAITAESIDELTPVHKYPELSHIQTYNGDEVTKFAEDLAKSPNPTVKTYREYFDELAAAEKKTGERYSQDARKIAEKELTIESNLDPEGLVDLGDGTESRVVTKRELFDELKEEKTTVTEFADCLKGGANG